MVAVRLQDGDLSAAGYAGWRGEKDAYVFAEQPWRRADLVVHGGDSVPYDRETQAVLSRRGRDRVGRHRRGA